MRVLIPVALCAAAILAGCATQPVPKPQPVTQNGHDRCAFIGRTDLSDFTKTPGTNADEFVLTSPAITAPINWDELIASWNVPHGVYLKVEARAIFPDHETKYYTLGLWSEDTAHHPRESVDRQRDDDGTVQTDTLVLKRHGGKVQLRLTVGGADASAAPIKFLGLSFCDSETKVAPRPANHAAWGKTVEVPERKQAEYEGGGGWCSPTSVSMVMAYWSEDKHRPDWDHTVPQTANAIQDDVMGGTGNWPFNTAFAGSFPGMRAYVTRLDDISELEDWIVAGFTPIISVSSFINVNHKGGDNGHLIVCVGFTKTGDVLVNDPGVSTKPTVRARKMYERQHTIDCWQKSKNTVYLIYPENAPIPKNIYGHWDNGK